MTMAKVCFVAPKAYSVLSGKGDVQHIGGAEVQQARIARALLDRGYGVSFITLDVGQPDGEELDGIRIHRSYQAGGGLPGLRFLHPRATAVWSAMRRAGAKIYYQRTSDPLTGVVAAFCRRYDRKFVFALGHDGDCDPALPFCRSLRERVPYRYGLKAADAVVAQTATQQLNLLRHFGVQSVVIPSCHVTPPLKPAAAHAGTPRMVWLGRFAPEKRLELLLEVASRCGDVEFDVLGDGPAGPYVAELKERASMLENVNLVGYVPHTEVAGHYEKATGLICTSSSEGFPNTFLEAWSRGLAVVTSFDPDGIVKKHGLGLVSPTADGLAEAVRSICADADERDRLCCSAHDYFLANHTVDAAVSRYDDLFRRLLGLQAPSRDEPACVAAGAEVS